MYTKPPKLKSVTLQLIPFVHGTEDTLEHNRRLVIELHVSITCKMSTVILESKYRKVCDIFCLQNDIYRTCFGLVDIDYKNLT